MDQDRELAEFCQHVWKDDIKLIKSVGTWKDAINIVSPGQHLESDNGDMYDVAWIAIDVKNQKIYDIIIETARSIVGEHIVIFDINQNKKRPDGIYDYQEWLRFYVPHCNLIIGEDGIPSKLPIIPNHEPMMRDHVKPTVITTKDNIKDYIHTAYSYWFT